MKNHTQKRGIDLEPSVMIVPRWTMPMWIIVVGLVAAFQPPRTMMANILLLGIGGLMIPLIWLMAVYWYKRAKRGA